MNYPEKSNHLLMPAIGTYFFKITAQDPQFRSLRNDPFVSAVCLFVPFPIHEQKIYVLRRVPLKLYSKWTDY